MNRKSFASIAAALSLACGGSTLEPVGDGPSGGTGGSSGGSGGAGAGGAGTGGTSGSGGAGSGGASSPTHQVRIGFVQGQETTGEFCVAYELDSGGSPIWDPAGLLAPNGYPPSELAGLDKLSRYLPLSKAPVAFGKAYSKCTQDAVVRVAFPPAGATYFTLLTVPYSNEADEMWVLGDSGPSANPTPGVRIVNAATWAHPIAVSLSFGDSGPVSLGEMQFGNAPNAYVEPGEFLNHAHGMTLTDLTLASTHTFSFTQFDLLPLANTTVFVSAVGLTGQYQVLACSDAYPTTVQNAKFSDCWYTTEQ